MKAKKLNSQQHLQPDVDALAAKLRALIQPEAHEIPKGFEPINYWVDRLGVDDSAAYAMLKEGVRKGLMSMQKFRRERGAKATQHWQEV